MTNNCKIKLENNKDSTIIRGDVIVINDAEKELEVDKNVIITGDELDGKCEKMKFTSNYTSIKMLNNPVLWLNKVQLIGDEIELYTESNELDSIYIEKQPFIIYPNDSLEYYNQIKGNLLNGKFTQNKIDYINILGNGQMKYFEKNKEENHKISINNTEASKIQLKLENNNIKKVICFQEIESNQIDIQKENFSDIDPKLLYLDGFTLRNREN